MSAIGALPERLRGGGLAVPPGDTMALHSALRRVTGDPQLLGELTRSVPRDFHTIADTVEVYREAYRLAVEAVRART